MTDKGRVVSHPGVYIKDAIDELGLSQSEFAYRTGLTIKNVSTLINGESNITFDVAVKLASFFHNSVEGWINLQTKYNLYLNEQNRQKEYEEDWLIAKKFNKDFCYSILDIEIDSKHKEDTIDQLRTCFNVVTLQNLKSPDMYAFYRTSVTKDINTDTIILRNAWISIAEQKAREMSCSEFNKECITNNQKYLRSLTLKGPRVIGDELKDFLSSCGIKLVILPFLKGSNLSGVTKWISNESCVMVAVNDYGKDADKIWFSIFHELGHAMKNHKRHLTISLNKDNVLDDDEIEANEFAKNLLIDEKDYQEFVTKKDFSLRSIERFAKEQSVADFIVVGRLQKDKLIDWSHFQNIKQKYTISF